MHEFDYLSPPSLNSTPIGFPNFAPPKFLMDSIVKCLDNPLNHQYVPPRGVPRLLEALSKLLSPSYQRIGHNQPKLIDPASEILVTQGANQAILVIFQTYLRPGDVVLVLAPFFDIYEPLVVTTGAKLVSVPFDLDTESLASLQSGSVPSVTAESLFRFPFQALREAIDAHGREKCKFLLLNSPHNPSGKCWTEKESVEICNFVKSETDLALISDEVASFLLYNIDI